MMPKFIVPVVAFIALGLRVVGTALVKEWSTMKASHQFDSEEKKTRRALWAKRGGIFIKTSTWLLLAVASWAVVSASLAN